MLFSKRRQTNCQNQNDLSSKKLSQAHNKKRPCWYPPKSARSLYFDLYVGIESVPKQQ